MKRLLHVGPPTSLRMNVADAAAALGVHPNTIRNMAADGRLTNIAPTPLKVLRFDPAEVEALANRKDPR